MTLRAPSTNWQRIYNWNDVENLEVMKYIDILVDGQFKEELSVPSPNWCGSSNQRIINVQESLKRGEVILYVEQI